MNDISEKIPWLIFRFGKKNLEMQIGFSDIDFSADYMLKYTFKYVSSGGYAAFKHDVVMDIDNLNRFVKYLSQRIEFKKSVAGQRALMTSNLRKKIKERDGYKCRNCGASLQNEPNLLLEIDHIIPLSKGGITTEDNLQTLCWRCNRNKGSKIL